MSGPPTIRPDRSVIERIVDEEARAAGAAFLDVIGSSNKPTAKAARTRAIRRIMDETGCSHRGLEAVWGSGLRRLARRYPQSAQVDDPTMARLTWQYGPERALEIAAGCDPATNADLASWRRVIGRAA